MILLTATLALAFLFASTSSEAQGLRVSREDTRTITDGPRETFTGQARIERLFEATDPSHASGGAVSFEPGARTAWHTHPRGQVLLVTAGAGRVQVWGGAIVEIRTGDVVQIPANTKHWHGASPSSSMTHLAISEHRDGTVVEWLEPVSDSQYNEAPASPPATQQTTTAPRPSGPQQQRLAPGLAALTDNVLFGDVWIRPELSPRDRSLVTISVLIATGKSAPLTGHLGRALNNGVLPSEASGVLAHLAIYAGWPSAVSALDVFQQVYDARKVDTDALRLVTTRLDAPASDDARAQAVASELGALAPKFVSLTNDVVFGDLWRRTDLSTRDRSLVTIAALAAMGDDDQLDVYVNRGVEAGLTRAQMGEALTHLAFYAGWPKATKALAAVSRALAN